MLLFNIILVLILLGFIGSALSDGFIKSLGRIIGAIIGFLIAKALYVQFGSLLAVIMPVGWARFFAFLIIFMVAVRVMGWVFGAFDKTYNFLARLPFMKSANHILGGVLGFIEGIIVLGGLIWIVKTFKLIPSLVYYVNGSTVSAWIFAIFNKVLGILI